MEEQTPKIDPTLYCGRPADETVRLPVEVATYDLLDRLQIPYTRIDHEPLYTMEACLAADRLLGVTMCKNLLLCNAQKTQFYLLLMPGEKRFQTKVFSKAIGSSRLSFAPEDAMRELLGLTPGSVSVLGLQNDTEHRVTLYIDREVLQASEIGCHPCINTSSLKLSTKDVLEKFLPAVRHTYAAVELPVME